MIIVTTPMCEKILDFAGVKDFKVNKNPYGEDADLAILLSETKTKSKMPSLKLKLNTFSQIKDSIVEVSKYRSSKIVICDDELDEIFKDYEIAEKWLKDEKEDLKRMNSSINVKVYSNFVRDIVEDMGFNVVNDETRGYSYFIYPDYLDVEINEEKRDYNCVELPSHGNVPLDPIKRAEIRYSILESISD